MGLPERELHLWPEEPKMPDALDAELGRPEPMHRLGCTGVEAVHGRDAALGHHFVVGERERNNRRTHRGKPLPRAVLDKVQPTAIFASPPAPFERAVKALGLTTFSDIAPLAAPPASVACFKNRRREIAFCMSDFLI